MLVVRSVDREVRRRPPPQPTLQRLVDATVGATTMTLLVNRLRAGEEVGAHLHDVEEILVVVDGECVVHAGRETSRLSAGDAVIVPPHTLHSLGHAGVGIARVVAVLGSAHAMPAVLSQHH